MAGNGHDVRGRRGTFGGQQVVLLSLVVGQPDADLDARILLELVDEGLRYEFVIGRDVDDLTLSKGGTDDRWRGQYACARRQQFQSRAAGYVQILHVVLLILRAQFSFSGVSSFCSPLFRCRLSDSVPSPAFRPAKVFSAMRAICRGSWTVKSGMRSDAIRAMR
ncbi:hypothetical protein D9M72_490750 [compost metagenome]